MNKVLLTGRLTRDPEMRSLASGKVVTTFTVASNEFIGGGQGEGRVPPRGDLGPPGRDRRALPRQGPAGRHRGPPPDPLLGRRSRRAALEDRGRGRPRRDAVRAQEEGLRGAAGRGLARGPGIGARRGSGRGADPRHGRASRPPGPDDEEDEDDLEADEVAA